MNDDLTELLTIDELEANTQALAAKFGDRVTITRIGESWAGRPIEMISIGEGEQNALVVGVPHPNEPVGAVTVERMIRLMLGPDGKRERRGMKWHFIKAIDPEGLRLNAGWLKGPRTLRNYAESYFRPALSRQPETTFPLEIGEHRFSASTPENQAWQRAFELTKPIVHASLHHCDIGGAFHCVSRNIPALNPVLDQIILDQGLTHMTGFQAPDVPIEWVSAGVSVYPAVPQIVAPGLAQGLDVEALWPFGEMSPGYAEAKFGTFTIMTEVPLWDDERLRDDSASGLTEGDVFAHQRREYGALAAYLDRYLPHLRPASRDGEEIYAAMAEFGKGVAMIEAHFAQQESTSDLSVPLSVQEHLKKTLLWDVAAARFYGMARRLAGMTVAEGQGAEAQSAFDEADAELDRLSAHVGSAQHFRPAPLSALTAIQMHSILASADAVRRAA